MDQHILYRAAATVSARIPAADICAVVETTPWYPEFSGVLVECSNRPPVLVTIAQPDERQALERQLVLETALKNSVDPVVADMIGSRPLARIIGEDGTTFLMHHCPQGGPISEMELSDYQCGYDFGGLLAALHGARLSHIASLGVGVWDGETWPELMFSKLQRAIDTGHVPVELRDFFTESFHCWPDFQPSCLHGDLAEECIYTDSGRVTGLVGLNEVFIGDPAHDLAWVCAAASENFLAGFADSYHSRYAAGDESLWERAQVLRLFQPLAWLAYCAQSGDKQAIKDAREMVEALDLNSFSYPDPRQHR